MHKPWADWFAMGAPKFNTQEALQAALAEIPTEALVEKLLIDIPLEMVVCALYQRGIIAPLDVAARAGVDGHEVPDPEQSVATPKSYPNCGNCEHEAVALEDEPCAGCNLLWMKRGHEPIPWKRKAEGA